MANPAVASSTVAKRERVFIHILAGFGHKDLRWATFMPKYGKFSREERECEKPCNRMPAV